MFYNVFEEVFMENIEKLQIIIDESSNIVFFGGAGVSTESGIPDFRSVDGLYSQEFDFPPEVMLSRTFFDVHPDEFYRFYRDKVLFTDKLPNPAHIYLAKLEEAGKLKAVITQNIDGLHSLAGSKNVIELHGSIYRNYCMKCNKSYSIDEMKAKMPVPHCDCDGIIKPDVVLYEEPLNNEDISAAIKYISEADVLIIGGTSLIVYPAAGLLEYFKGSKLILINRDETPKDRLANLILRENIGELFSKLRV